jgi:hypothetical protein
MPEWFNNYGKSRIDDGPAFAKVKGIQIPKCAGETRDGVCMHTYTKRLLTKVGKAISQLIDQGIFKKRCPGRMDADELDSKLSFLSRKYDWFLCQDFEKNRTHSTY